MRKVSELDFEMWGREVAVNYLTHNKPMNESIVKLAQDNLLNYEQIKRVVEESNNQTYLQKFASSQQKDDKYIEFEVADAKKIVKLLNTTTKEAELSDDYSLSPKEHKNFNTGFSATINAGVNDMLPEATPTEKMAMIRTSQGIYEQFENKMNRLSRLFEEKTAELKTMYKHANLDETLPDPAMINAAIDTYIKNTCPPNSLKEKLAAWLLADVRTTDEIAKVAGVLNEDTTYIRKFKEALDIGSQYSAAYDTGPDTSKILEKGTRNEKTAAFATAVENNLWKLLVAGGLASAVGVTAHKAGYEKGKQVQSVIMSPMKQLPASHNPVRR